MGSELRRETGKYSIKKTIHKSGRTEIFKALNENNKPVILKIYSSLNIGDFRYEYEVTRSLKDLDGVINYSGLEYIDGNPAIVMEDIAGESIDSLIARGNLRFEDVISIIISLLNTLTEIHNSNLIHKRLCPSNIIYNKKTGVVKVIDFKTASRLIPDTYSNIEKEDVYGGYLNLSPEQRGIIDSPIDYRTDIYSFGVTIYQLLTNDLYLDLDCIALLQNNIPDTLFEIIVRMTNKQPDQRYKSMNEISDDFRNYLKEKNYADQTIKNDSRFLTKSIDSKLLDIMQESVFIADMNDMKIIYTNKEFDNEIGFNSDYIWGKTFDELNLPITKKILQKLKKKNRWEGHLNYFDSDGNSFYTYSKLEVLEDLEFGSILLGINTDITEFSETEKRYESLFNQMAVGVARVDLNRKWLEVNDKFHEIVGYNKNELSKMTFADITHPDDLELDESSIQKLVNGELDSFNMDKRYIKKGGEVIWVNLNVNLVYDINKKPSYFVGVIKDISERKSLTEKLYRSNKLLVKTSLMAKIGGWEIDLETRKSYFTEEISNILGIDKSEAISIEDGINFYAPESRSVIRNAIKKAINNNEKFDLELPFITNNGRSIWVRTLGEVETSNGKPLKLFGAIQDITYRKNIEEKLNKSIKFTENVINSLADTFYILNPKDGKGIHWNKALSDVSGYDEEYFRNNAPGSSYPEDEHPLIEKAIRTALDKGRSTVQLSYIVKSGKIIPYEYSVVPIKSPEGETWICAIGRDITERKKAESELKSLQSYLENIIDFMPSVVIGIDNCCNITEWNREASNYTGLNKKDVIGLNLKKINLDIDEIVDLLHESVSKKIVVNKSREVVINSKKHHESIYIYPLLSSDREGAVIRIDDITKEIELQEKLSQSQKMEAIGQLAGGIAHDFNNTLAGILGAAQLINNNKNSVDDLSLKYSQVIIEATSKASNQIQKLLSFSRKVDIPSKVYNLHQIIDDSIVLLEGTIDKKIVIKVIKQAENVNSIGESSAIQNAIINMIINSSHALENGGTVILKTDNVYLDDQYCSSSHFDVTSGNYISLEISDNGTGIPENHISKIFDPFFTTKKQGKGSGLGLSAVFGTVNDHHGSIEVHSKVGIGTKIIIYLPCTDKETDNRKDKYEDFEGNETILLIEDDEIVRITTETLLDTMGYNVIMAEDGIEGIKVYRKLKDKIDIIICDMIMPNMNGSETFDELKRINPDCKVIISSGYTKKEVLSKMKKDGISGFLQKPFASEELLKLIQTTINK